MAKLSTITKDPSVFAVGRELTAPVKPMTAVPPLLLLPLRLEYRVVEPGPTVKILDTTNEIKGLADGVGAIGGDSPLALRKRAQARKEFARAHARKALPLVVRSAGGKEVWFRWYPDESFAEKGIASVSPEEERLLSEFRIAIGARDWWNVDDAQVSAAWQAFAQAVGPYRAMHLLRRGSANTQEGATERIGRIAALPNRVALFAAKGEVISLLGEGSPISTGTEKEAGVAYTANAIGTGGWISDFSAAVAMGMGMMLTEKARVEEALEADWIIAIGLHGEDATDEITALLRDQIANGEFEFLTQDAPTNNSPNELSIKTDPRADLNRFMRVAAEEERRTITAGAELSAASQLAHVLGVDATVVRKAVRAGDAAFADAQAMLRVIGPALLNDVVERVPDLRGVAQHEFLEALAECAAARGTLPPVRAGRHAFGILTMTDVDAWGADAREPQQLQRIHTFMAQYAKWARKALPVVAEQLMPVIQPGDPEAAEKLNSILQAERVSNRVDSADGAGAEIHALGCPYVDGSAVHTKAVDYLKKLRTATLARLPDPTSAQREWPLLYRLARLSIIGNIELALVAARTGSKAYPLLRRESANAKALKRIASGLLQAEGLSVTLAADLERTAVPGWTDLDAKTFDLINTRFRDALSRLEGIANGPDGSARLLTLMMEVLDLLQHRVDAWSTGLAYAQLATDRRRGVKGLKAGYYGFLGKLRPTSATGATDGFILAPSLAQATSAAVMRSAYLRHAANGAFAIDLRSRRTRRALLVLDAMRKGTTLGESLGMRGERWLHDKNHDALIAALRDRFALKNQEPPEGTTAKPIGRRLFDGLAFLENGAKGFTGTDKTRIEELHAALSNDMDAVADLVMAEAVHQRAMGAAGSANAWLQVLSGAPVPGEPDFIRTQRYGQGANYRVSMFFTEGTADGDDAPRAVAEPTLARLAKALLTGFGAAQVSATLQHVVKPDETAPGPDVDVRMNLRNDLGMWPIDLVIGGRSELLSRFRHRLFERWLRDPLISQAMRLDASFGLEAWQKVDIKIDVARTDAATEELITKAETIRRALKTGRPLEPADLNAAALPESALDEPAEAAMVSAAATTLRQRADALLLRAGTDQGALATAHQDFMHAVVVAKDALVADPASAATAAALSPAETKRRTLVDRLWTASAWSEPSAIQPVELHAIIADTPAFDGRISALITRLGKRTARLTTAINGIRTGTLAESRTSLAALIAAVRGSLDGEALPILPPYPRPEALRPQVTTTADASMPLEKWGGVRKGVQAALDLYAIMPSGRPYYVTAEATDDKPEHDTDTRDASNNPDVLHYGVLIGTEAQVRSSATVLGVVLDEWAEQRPSATHTAAMAINYDSPQAEPPHCLLLCVPARPAQSNWSRTAAAHMVVELIAWMKVRALSTREKPTPSSLLPGANQVAFKKVDGKFRPRIPGPVKKVGTTGLQWFQIEGQFLAAGTGDIVGPSLLDDHLLKGKPRIND